MKSINIENTHIRELVINWHITEACNYSCNYCFAKWGKPNELHRSLEAIEALLNNLADFFIKGNSPLKQKLSYENVRLNIAGGEPMMLGSTFSIVLMLAKQKGFKTSIITNGHYLLNNKFDLPNNVLDMVGISFDSQNYDVRRQIGRIDRKGNSLSSDGLKLALEKLSSTQQGLKTKINTVVNKFNWQEDFVSLISEIRPYKWKALQVMPYGEDSLLISNKQFNHFVDKHSNAGLPIFAESNIAMTESYLMIDPKGCFYQNSSRNSGYKYSDSINKIGAANALKQINFNEAVFKARYLPIEPVVLINEGANYEK
ncbi:viperin family antiviral radical SAM protein [Colwellia sp. Arc7-D]|uniref:viperin family antiviral radical SAM protein n=1 Tax=Colwellia sp. Arc7-D TaxID=2161872 RepID=UPI000D33BCEE|nr:viperin family antiviral radical SAM protein [Colwellia sp. Arc7-D]AWB57854.1 radical SAM protein [Colwellia sp. Arc7-D]